MASLKESLAGPGFVILNAIRVLNIIVFLDIIAASVVMTVKISLLSSFFFFQAVSHAMAAGVSKLPFFRGYFDRNWPLLGQDSGFITLAVAMLILGMGVLGDLNTPATSQESLGLAFWRIVVSAGILAMVMSVINLASSFIFSDRAAGVTARHVRVYGAVAPQKVVTRASSQRSFKLGIKREDSLPTYTPSHSPVRRQASMRSITRFPLKISPPMNLNDAASSKYSRDSSGVTIPDLAHHPAMYSSQV
ncbi:hypothetical protein IFM46972_05314 [Aspergillus udagawae]|uniref:DUF7598 domain-containing protein n=1 Tax=Aspergillus udagawae TaxID=91492 RepID=A0A8H3RU16_9EURO|nr:hypothetical protein IFM46972_05314 [Aspergillus udagawae]